MPLDGGAKDIVILDQRQLVNGKVLCQMPAVKMMIMMKVMMKVMINVVINVMLKVINIMVLVMTITIKSRVTTQMCYISITIKLRQFV